MIVDMWKIVDDFEFIEKYGTVEYGYDVIIV